MINVLWGPLCSVLPFFLSRPAVCAPIPFLDGEENNVFLLCIINYIYFVFIIILQNVLATIHNVL